MPVQVWDTLHVSMAAGWQAIAAAEMAAAGLRRGRDPGAARRHSRPRVRWRSRRVNLKYLIASGRAPRLQGMIGDLLNIKPILVTIGRRARAGGAGAHAAQGPGAHDRADRDGGRRRSRLAWRSVTAMCPRRRPRSPNRCRQALQRAASSSCLILACSPRSAGRGCSAWARTAVEEWQVKIVVDAMGGDHAPGRGGGRRGGRGARARDRHHPGGHGGRGAPPSWRSTATCRACRSRSCTRPRSSRWRSTRWPSGPRRTPRMMVGMRLVKEGTAAGVRVGGQLRRGDGGGAVRPGPHQGRRAAGARQHLSRRRPSLASSSTSAPTQTASPSTWSSLRTWAAPTPA